MRIAIWPAGLDDDATSQYRLLMPAAALAAQGADVVIDRKGPTVGWDRVWDPNADGGRPPLAANVEGVAPYDADVVVMQRPGRKFWAQLIPYLQKNGIRVVVDVDDRFDKIDPANVAAGDYDPKRNIWHNHEWIARACQRADLVTATTPSLIDRYGYGHGRVLPNLIPERYLSVEPHRRRREAIGWSGNVKTHPNDLQVTEGAVQRALDGTSWGFHAVGTGRGVRAALKLIEEPTATASWVAFADYPAYLAELGIGIVPLADTVFNHGKSGLKMAEMAAVGVPVVASPTPDNERLNGLGVGLLAPNPGRWQKHLTALLRSPERRADLAGQGREAMAHWTYEKRCGWWMDAWTGASDRTKAAV